MPQEIKKDKKRRGFILLTHAVMLLFTVAMIGLAVDAGTMYVIKGRLSSAVDAAALAAGRSVNLANTVAAASAAATTTATQFFNANFPNGYLGTGAMNLSTPTFTQETDSNGNPNGILDIKVQASVPAPTYFMQIFGISTVTVSGTGTATRRGTVMILVLDTSVSMNTLTTPTACNAMKAAAQQFITNFSPYDTIGAIRFDVTATLIYPPDNKFGNGTLSADIGALTCGSSTNTAAALYLAYEQIKTVGLPLAYNSIVLFTDGSPNGVSANFPIKLATDTRYGDTSSSYPSMTTPYSMPASCTGGTTVTGTITQGSGQTAMGGTYGVTVPITGYTGPSYPASCSGDTGAYMREMIAYIPDLDEFGNSTHGVIATGTGPTVATVGGVSMVTRDFYVFQQNNLCAAPTGSAATACATTMPTANHQFGGDLWANYSSYGSGSNFFTAGPYKGKFRPDQPNTIVAASMNTAMSEAYNIRADASGCGGLGGNGAVCSTLYHPVINTIYLTGNVGDEVDREFLPIIANTQKITALPYDNSTFVPYINPAFQTNQEQGLYQVTADKSTLQALFQKLASEVLRLSQ